MGKRERAVAPPAAPAGGGHAKKRRPPSSAPRPAPTSAAESAAAAAADDAAAVAAEVLAVPTSDAVGVPGFKNKERVLLLSSRGITHRCEERGEEGRRGRRGGEGGGSTPTHHHHPALLRFRHLLLDLAQLLPHAKRDAKLDTKSERGAINEVAEERSCSSAMFLEARKRSDLYLWLARPPDGPSAKFLVTGVHTMAELRLTGNHVRGTRAALSFGAGFDAAPHLRLLKEMLTQTFAVPRRHPKSKPFFDHVIAFAWADGRVWLRNYQVVPAADRKPGAPVSLAEVGPRATLQPIKIFAGSFGGRVLYDNPAYVSPNAVRAALKRRDAGAYAARVAAQAKRRAHVAAHPAPRGALADVFRG